MITPFSNELITPFKCVRPDPEYLSSLTNIVARELKEEQGHSGSDEPATVTETLGPVYVALRVDGKRMSSAWSTARTLHESLVDAVRAAKSRVRRTNSSKITTVEICLSHSYRAVGIGQDGSIAAPSRDRGILGIEFTFADQSYRYSPTLMLANNWGFKRALQHFLTNNNLNGEEVAHGLVQARLFECEQALVTLVPSPYAKLMNRGSTLVTMEQVTQSAVGEVANLLGSWLAQAVQADGRMTYKYWPSRQAESSTNNMIRQWMATVALIRFARTQTNAAALLEIAERNIRYNLNHFYREEGGLGLIEYDGSVKLGAIALAGLALTEHPKRAEYAREEEALCQTVSHLWNEDGSFKTFYLPSHRNDNQNFYPGEALLLWAALFQENHDPDLLNRIMNSFQYYRTWHLDARNRNPAFVPWHTQAYFNVWRHTHSPDLQDFIFEMNDWLLGMQQWDTAEYPDLQGRFYDPARPHFGVPHASSTGVYLEGLIDAFNLARTVGETERADRYRCAIRRGIRSVMQLQYRDEVDLFHVQSRERNHVFGGVRTDVYHNEIRVDNVQHNLMAILKILETFSPSDYQD